MSPPHDAEICRNCVFRQGPRAARVKNCENSKELTQWEKYSGVAFSEHVSASFVSGPPTEKSKNSCIFDDVACFGRCSLFRSTQKGIISGSQDRLMTVCQKLLEDGQNTGGAGDYKPSKPAVIVFQKGDRPKLKILTKPHKKWSGGSQNIPQDGVREPPGHILCGFEGI